MLNSKTVCPWWAPCVFLRYSNSGSKGLVDDIIESGGPVGFMWFAVSGQLCVDRAFGIVASKTSSLSGVINNAGIVHSQPLEDLTDTQMGLTMNPDLKGMMGVCHAGTSIQDTTGARFYFLSFFYGRSLSWLGQPCALCNRKSWSHWHLRFLRVELMIPMISPPNFLLTETLDHLIGSHYASPEPA